MGGPPPPQVISLNQRPPMMGQSMVQPPIVPQAPMMPQAPTIGQGPMMGQGPSLGQGPMIMQPPPTSQGSIGQPPPPMPRSPVPPSIPGAPPPAPGMPTIPSGKLSLNGGDELQVVSGQDVIVVSIEKGSGLEVFGEPLLTHQSYVICPYSSVGLHAMLSCDIQVSGGPHVARIVQDNAARHSALFSVATSLNKMRSQAFNPASSDMRLRRGPNVLVLGGLGKTTGAKTLQQYACRSGWAPVAVNLDPRGGPEGEPENMSGGAGCLTARYPDLLATTLEKTLKSGGVAKDTVEANPRGGRRQHDQKARLVTTLSSLAKREASSCVRGDKYGMHTTNPTVPMTLCAWEQYVRPLATNNTVSVFFGMRSVTEADPSLSSIFLRVAEDLADRMREYEETMECQVRLLLRSSGYVIDCPRGLSEEAVETLCEVFNVTDIVHMQKAGTVSVTSPTLQNKVTIHNIPSPHLIGTIPPSDFPPSEEIPRFTKVILECPEQHLKSGGRYVNACRMSAAAKSLNALPPSGMTALIPLRLLVTPMPLPTFAKLSLRPDEITFLRPQRQLGPVEDMIGSAAAGMNENEEIWETVMPASFPCLGGVLCSRNGRAISTPGLLESDMNLFHIYVRNIKCLGFSTPILFAFLQ